MKTMNNHTSSAVRWLALATMIASNASAAEVIFNCAIVSATSTATQTTDMSAPFVGALIGNYDATTMPTGTRTIPGYFGGSGNNAIPYTASFVVAGDIVSHPVGTLTLGVDSAGLQVRVSNLDFDFLGAVPGVLAATVNINYQSFHTVAPTSIYPGGVTIPVPVGDAVVSQFDAVQTGKGIVGVLLPQKNGTKQFTIAVPVNYIIVATAIDQPVSDGTPVPGILTLIGVLVESTGTVALAIDISNSENATQPVKADPFLAIPLALPTVLPSGGIANILLSGDVTSLTVAQSLVASIDIAGVRQPMPADLNGDWVVNAMDLSLLLANWGGSGVGDITGDGVVSAADLSLLLAYWS